MFNMGIEEIEDQRYQDNGLDPVSKEYFTKLSQLRTQQKTLIPLFLDTKKKVAKHKKLMRTILHETQNDMPL